MTVFNPQTLTATPQAVAQALMLNGAPAALVSLFDGTRSAHGVAGVADMEEGDAARIGQSFQAGSQTKMIASVVLLQLAEVGLVDLDRSFADYLPAEMLAGIANAPETSLRQALAMRSGIADFTSQTDGDGLAHFDRITAENPETVIGTDVALDLVRGLPASFAPGAGFEYSNTNYALLGQVIEAVTGAPLGAVMAALVFEPLGMEDSFLEDFSFEDDRLAAYLRTDDEVIEVSEALQDLSAQGGVISTTGDMARFLQALLVEQSLLSPDALAQMADFTSTGLGPMSFGLGLIRYDFGELGTLVGFSGGTLGHESATFLHLESGRILSTAVNMSNLDLGAVAGLLVAAEMVQEDPAWAPDSEDGPLQVQTVSAADLDIIPDEDGFEISAQGASLRVEAALSDLERDDIHFDDGSVLLTGGAGRDQILLGRSDAAFHADNQILGLSGSDHLQGGAGDDRILGGTGHDWLRGRAGDDVLSGGAGRDFLRGGIGKDAVFGGAGRDVLRGGAGDDRLEGGAGDDRLLGGAGADIFVFGDSSENGRREFDRILDFNTAEDALDLGGAEIAAVRERDDRVILTFEGDGDLVMLMGVSDADAISFL